MNQDPVRVHQVHWSRVFPFLRLFQAGGLGWGLSTLVLALVCVLTSWTGSMLLFWLFNGTASSTAVGFCNTSFGLRLQWQGPFEFWLLQPAFPPPVHGMRSAGAETFLSVIGLRSLVQSHAAGASGNWYASPVLLVWNALVLGQFGTAMARTVATEFCQQSRCGVIASVRYALRHWKSTLLSTGLVLAFPAGLKLAITLVSLVTRLGSFGELLAGAVWGLVLLASVVLALICLVGSLAWLLSLAAIGTDGCTGAEALSRCISYLLSHPFLAATALFVATVIALAMRWIMEIILAAGTMAMPPSFLSMDPNQLVNSWLFFIRMTPHAVHLSAFMAGITVCYVLLRQREDGITTEELDGAA